MNAITTTQFEVITSETVRYSNPTDLTVKTQEEKVVLGKALDKDARLKLDTTMTARILDIADEAESQHGTDYSREYLGKAKGIVTDAHGKIERRINLLAQQTTTTVEVEDNEKVTELEAKIAKQEQELKDIHTTSGVTRGGLEADLRRANEVIQKLQAGDDVTRALEDNAKLKSQLSEVQEIAEQVPSLKNDADAQREALAGAKTIANGLKREIQIEKDKVIKAQSDLDKNTGEALLSHEQKQNAKALASVEVAKQVRLDYPLNTFLTQNGMTEDEIKSATQDSSRTVYDTKDVEDIASIIYNERNAVSDTVIVDKIEALVADAIKTVAQTDNSHTYETLSNTWRMECAAITKNSLEG